MTKYALVYVNEANVKWYQQGTDEPGEEVEVGFHETQFPTSISYGSRGGPGYKTSIITLQSGAEERVAHLSMPRHRYNVAEGVKSYDDLMELKRFYVARLGPANGFRFKDWLDFTSNADGRTTPTTADQTIGSGTAGGQTAYQLVKRYVNGSQSVVRTITKPVAGTVVAEINGTPTTDFTVDTTTGVITFNTAPTQGHTVKAGFQFDVPVRFGEEVDELLDISLDAYDSGSLSVPLVELFSETVAEDDYWYGGATTLTMTGTTTLTKGHGRVINCVNTTGGNLTLNLPAKADLALGGPHFIIHNDGSSNANILVKDGDTATSKISLLPSAGTPYICEAWLGLDASSARTWYILR